MRWHAHPQHAVRKRRKAPGAVGYKRPPKATQFKPGQSGNPRGRPKGSKNFATILEKELAERIPATINGSPVRITKRHAVVLQLANQAAAGDHKSIQLLLKLTAEHEGSVELTPGIEPEASAEDRLVMASIVRRIRAMDESPALSYDSAAPPVAASASSPNQPSEDGDET